MLIHFLRQHLGCFQEFIFTCKNRAAMENFLHRTLWCECRQFFAELNFFSNIVLLFPYFVLWTISNLWKSWRIATMETHLPFNWIPQLLTFCYSCFFSLYAYLFVCVMNHLKLSCRHHEFIPKYLRMQLLKIRPFSFLCIHHNMSHLRKLILTPQSCHFQISPIVPK